MDELIQFPETPKVDPEQQDPAVIQDTGHSHHNLTRREGEGEMDDEEMMPVASESDTAGRTDESGDEDEGEGQDTAVSELPDLSLRTAMSHKKKPKSKRGLGAPTGFEDYHADAPLGAAEHAEERLIYDRSIPFTSRILTAIQRFETRRKLNSELRDIFFKYLQYGGVDVGPRMFQGGYSREELELMDKDQLTWTMSRASIGAEKENIGEDTSSWALDFEGVMKGFLSRRATFHYGFEIKEQVDNVTKVLTNFLNYLLHHDVCPEYAGDILGALKVCEVANKELWACAEAQRWLPGDFNIACSTLFQGSYSKMYDGKMSWAPETIGASEFVGMTEEIAREVVKFAIAVAASEEVYQEWRRLATTDGIEVVEVREAVGFEITAIDPVDLATRKFYKDNSANYRPVGRIRAIPWSNPDQPPEDLTDEEKEKLPREADKAGMTPHSTGQAGASAVGYEFFIEEVVLQHLFVGMKIEATARKLNCGIWFLDEVLRAFCSFDTYLCNEMMIGWKEPRPVASKQTDIGDEESVASQEQ